MHATRLGCPFAAVIVKVVWVCLAVCQLSCCLLGWIHNQWLAWMGWSTPMGLVPVLGCLGWGPGSGCPSKVWLSVWGLGCCPWLAGLSTMSFLHMSVRLGLAGLSLSAAGLLGQAKAGPGSVQPLGCYCLGLGWATTVQSGLFNLVCPTVQLLFTITTHNQ